jgi:3-hydroxyacyl-CoA dehydrogenase/enoyl-CoA hydratase/3-hydroxybutyryl-CoA epimerase
VTAVLDGEVSGHALGLALACHRRVAAADACLSLPQVQLGLAPVAGAIARSVRLAGPVAALPLLLDGAVFTAAQAQLAGLVHAVAADATALALRDNDVQDNGPWRQPWDGRRYRLPGGGLEVPAVRALLQQAVAGLHERGTPAAEAILCAMVEGLQVNFDNALLIESRYFCQTALHRGFSTDLKRFL